MMMNSFSAVDVECWRWGWAGRTSIFSFKTENKYEKQQVDLESFGIPKQGPVVQN